MDRYFDAALRFHRYLIAHHWNGSGLIGPDPGIRLNYRIGRFIKGYLPYRKWRDDLYYLQAQGYWVLANWRLAGLTGEKACREIARRCSEHMVARQRDDGAWDYPNPEWKGRVATVEGAWAAIGLLETYRHTGNRIFLDAVLRWQGYLVDVIGFQRVGDQLAVNYFANRKGARVPNNAVNVLRYLAELADATGKREHLRLSADLLNFMRATQTDAGEFPYSVEGLIKGEARPHFQCYQYNAFQCLELVRYYEITRDAAALPLIARVLAFLRSGLLGDGHVAHECGSHHRAVTYHSAALGAAFAKAGQLGIHGYGELADRAFGYVMRMQRPDGSCLYSRHDYHVLSDRRSYPRHLAMMLYHLLLRHLASREAVASKDTVICGS